MNEFKQWADYVVSHIDVDDIPSYIFEVSQFSGCLARIFDVLGFIPEWPLHESQKEALYGIAYIRGIVKIHDYELSREAALKALEKNPDVSDYFRRTFPFIHYELNT
ncbi:hypothetical protein LRP50_23750 [Enterovibrio sp. ZSDZ42]|uniref:Uncharacterized protein n=1 Tax=Enterovibrio gelatinilyticus TaxID=2899819 RepID=A0ABT5R7E9_9GAMM|nr:hypothetical protein [Enterovibrio sp. ZSDZ42]MDD1796140.1 hypothetical protein [Enterovibrio sp. ZSDZ42]